MKKLNVIFIVLLIFLHCAKKDLCQVSVNIQQEYQRKLNIAFQNAGKNCIELQDALKKVTFDQRELMLFLITNMPECDLTGLSADYLVKNVQDAINIHEKISWGISIQDTLFQNYILPYSNINERRDQWRYDFFERFYPIVKDCKSPGEGAVKLNNEIWDILDVHYSTERPKADQSPYESIEVGIASCTGLSILLVDACRSVGIPARFVGIPKWVNVEGNHSWVEIWDDGWHFLGAGEPGPFDKTWFSERAAQAKKENQLNSIYAVSFKKTDVVFPAAWRNFDIEYVSGINITDRYTEIQRNQLILLSVRVFNTERGKRVSIPVILCGNRQVISSGKSVDETKDLNDMLTFEIKPGENNQLRLKYNGKEAMMKIKPGKEKVQTITLYLDKIFD